MQEKKIVRVAFYIRVSTTEQGKTGFGLDYQLDALNDLIQYKGNQDPKWITNKKWFYQDSGLSGGNLQRPAYKKMIEDAKKGEFDMIAVWKIDRMSRNLSHLLTTFEELKQHKVGFYSIKENIDFTGPIGKLTFQIFGALAEFEREMIKSRTIEGKMASARMGNFIKGSAPFGYIKEKNANKKGSKLIIVKSEMDIVRKIFEWFVYEDLNYTQIGNKLTEMKIAKGDGGIRKNIKFTKWYDTTIKDIILTSAYRGYVEEIFKKDNEVFPIRVHTPKVISPQLFELAQTKVAEVSKENKGGKRKYLLSGKIFDAIELNERGQMRKFSGAKRTKGGHSYRRKTFIKSDGTREKNMDFPGKPLDEFVWNQIHQFINKPDKFFKIYKKQTTELNNISILREEVEMLNRRIDEEEVTKMNIERKEITGRFSEDKADKYILEANTNISNFSLKVNELNNKIDVLLNLELSKEIITKASEDFKGKVDNLDEKQKMRLADILVDKVLVYYGEGKDTVVKVIFRFNLALADRCNTRLEPTNTGVETKNTPKGVVGCDNGTPGRDRTHANLGPRPSALPLSYGSIVNYKAL